MSFIEIKLDGLDGEMKKISREFTELPKKMELAKARAINRTLQSLQGEAVKIATAEYTAKSANLKRRIKINKATAGRVFGLLEITDKPGIGLINFAPRPAGVISWKGVAPQNRKKVVSNKIKRNGARKVYREKGTPFTAEVANGRHIFVRSGQGKLERLFGPSLVFALYGKSCALEEKAEAVYLNRLRHEIEFLLGKNA